MKSWTIGLALSLALTSAAAAQTPPSPSPSASHSPAVADGSASLSKEAGAQVQAMIAGGGLTKVGCRKLFAQLISEGVGASNRDFLAELGAGAAFRLSYDGKTIDVPAPPPDVAGMGQFLNNPPNLYTLWDTPEHTEQLIELSRWGDRTESRVILLIGNMLDDAFQKSSLGNGYAPYVSTIGGQWKALKAVKDHDSRERAYALFTAGLSYSLDKAKKEGRAAPEPFLWEWTQSDYQKADFLK